MLDVRRLNAAAATLIGLSAKMLRSRLPRCWSSAVSPAPLVLDTYMVNILIRAFFVAIAAVTVDMLWGYCGTLTFGQSAFFGIGVYALAIVFTEYDFGSWQALFALGAAVGVAAHRSAALTGWLSFYPGSTPLYASVVSLVLPIVLVQILYSGGTFTGSSSGLVGFESSTSRWRTGFDCPGWRSIWRGYHWIMLRSDAGRVLKARCVTMTSVAAISASTPRGSASAC